MPFCLAELIHVSPHATQTTTTAALLIFLMPPVWNLRCWSWYEGAQCSCDSVQVCAHVIGTIMLWPNNSSINNARNGCSLLWLTDASQHFLSCVAGNFFKAGFLLDSACGAQFGLQMRVQKAGMGWVSFVGAVISLSGQAGACLVRSTTLLCVPNETRSCISAPHQLQVQYKPPVWLIWRVTDGVQVYPLPFCCLCAIPKSCMLSDETCCCCLAAATCHFLMQTFILSWFSSSAARQGLWSCSSTSLSP